MNDHAETGKANNGNEYQGPPERGDQSPVDTRDFTRPDEVLSASTLTDAEKRAILASWISDAHAVVDAPGSRRLSNGAVVGMNEILRALKSLDGGGASSGEHPERRPLARRRRARRSRWLHGMFRRNRSDDDDDPPPCPAVIAVPPFRPLTGEQASRLPRAAYRGPGPAVSGSSASGMARARGAANGVPRECCAL